MGIQLSTPASPTSSQSDLTDQWGKEAIDLYAATFSSRAQTQKGWQFPFRENEFDLFLRYETSGEVMTAYASLDYHVPRGDRSRAGIVINTMNYSIIGASLEMDYNDGELRVRQACRVSGMKLGGMQIMAKDLTDAVLRRAMKIAQLVKTDWLSANSSPNDTGRNEVRRNRDIEEEVGHRAPQNEQVSRPASASPLRGVIDTHIIDHRTVTKQRELGRGSFGVVYMANWNHTTVAVKEFTLANPNDVNADFQAEFETMTMLRHPNVVDVMGGWISPTPSIVMQYYSGGSLEDLIHENAAYRSWSLKKKLQIGADVAKGLVYLHQKRLVHSDLKPANIMLDQSGLAKIVDFGLSKFRGRLMSTYAMHITAVAGTLAYMAPEMMTSHRMSSATDTYAFGLILCELLTRERPFAGALNPAMLAMEVCAQGIRPPLPVAQLSNPRVNKLITQCWDKEPENRPSMSRALDSLMSEL